MFHDFCSWKDFLFLPGLHPGTAFVRATLTLSFLVYKTESLLPHNRSTKGIELESTTSAWWLRFHRTAQSSDSEVFVDS